MNTANIIEDFVTTETRIYEEYPSRWDRLLDGIREAQTVDPFKMFIREVYSFNSKVRLTSKELLGRVPSGMSLSHAALFMDRPVIWIRDFDTNDFVLHLIRWGLIPRDDIPSVFGAEKEEVRGTLFRKHLNGKTVDRAVDVAFETYKRAHKKLGLIIAATGTPERYREHPEVLAFLKRVSRVQGSVPFGGIRNEFIARQLSGEMYEKTFEEGLKRFSGDYYAAFRYAKMFALSRVPAFRKSVDAVLGAVSSDKTAVKEAYMTVYSSVYGSLLGVHPILGGKELHPDEISNLEIPAGFSASALGPAGVFVKKRIALPEIELDDAIRYGRAIRNVYKRLYLTRKSDVLDFVEVLPEIEDELREEVENLKAKIDVPSFASDFISTVHLAFQFFSHSNVGVFDILTATLPALYTVFVYYKLFKTGKRINELLERFLSAPVSTSVHCLVVRPQAP